MRHNKFLISWPKLAHAHIFFGVDRWSLDMKLRFSSLNENSSQNISMKVFMWNMVLPLVYSQSSANMFRIWSHICISNITSSSPSLSYYANLVPRLFTRRSPASSSSSGSAEKIAWVRGCCYVKKKFLFFPVWTGLIFCHQRQSFRDCYENATAEKEAFNDVIQGGGKYRVEIQQIFQL